MSKRRSTHSSKTPDEDSGIEESSLDPHTGQRRLPPLLRRAWYSLNQAFRRRIAHLEITPDQFTVLRWLHEDDTDGMTQRALTDLMASDPNTVTSVLTRMEKAGLIERRPHEKDKRAKRVRIKPSGKKVFEEARDIAVALQNHVLDVLPKNKQEQFLRHLDLIADAARDAAEHLGDPDTPPSE
ncbi:MAG: MarR family transcriptional regulator [Phycisphaera sp.]|nr:MarR family transcriptional regulator [Phycisphaera sp.]